MNLSDVIKDINTFIGDSSTDRVSAADRYQAATEATAWLLEELGNEHMVDRAEVEFLPTVMWYKMDNMTPYLLTSGELAFSEDEDNAADFTRVDARQLTTLSNEKYGYAIERFNGASYLGVRMPNANKYPHKDIIAFNKSDGNSYTGLNATNITKEKFAVSFEMATTGQSSTGLALTSEAKNLGDYVESGVIIFEVEIPDVTDVTSVSIKFGTDMATDHFTGVAIQDINGNALVSGVNTVKIKWSDLTIVGSADTSAITEWEFRINHETDKSVIEGLKFSDLRIAKPVQLNFKYIFYRVGQDTAGADIIEFGADTDVPFFIERYPQYKFAVAHKAAGRLYKNMRLFQEAGTEERDAREALTRYRKNFATERDMGSTAFKVAGINFNRRRVKRRR